MKKIAFSLLIIGLALPMLSLGQNTMSVSNSALGQVGSATEVQKIELLEKSIQSSTSDIYKLISPMAPIIAPIAPMSPITCTACVGGEFTGRKDFSGCPIYSCPVKKCPAGCECLGDTISCHSQPTCIACAGGEPTGQKDSSGCPIYSCSERRPTCYISDDLMNQYDKFISLLQDAQKANDLATVDSITQKIIDLKTQINASKTGCGGGSTTSATESKQSVAPEVKSGIISSGTVQMTKCEEVIRWEEKIAYYTKLSGLSDSDLQNQTNISRDGIKNILVELAAGLQNIKTQCSNQTTSTGTATTFISGPTKPIGVQSSQEIQSYYKAKIESITGTQNVTDQVKQLEALKRDKDQLVGDLIKNNKEIKASDINAVAKEINITKNEVKIDNVSVDAVGAKIFVNIGSNSVSVEPTRTNVIIKDKNLEITANKVSISSSSLMIGGIEVKFAASDVAKKLNVAPNAVELTTENFQPVYKLKIAEARKLFGFIKMDVQNTQTADANNGNLLNKSKPWYYFLTTK